eukprot:284211_1
MICIHIKLSYDTVHLLKLTHHATCTLTTRNKFCHMLSIVSTKDPKPSQNGISIHHLPFETLYMSLRSIKNPNHHHNQSTGDQNHHKMAYPSDHLPQHDPVQSIPSNVMDGARNFAIKLDPFGYYVWRCGSNIEGRGSKRVWG